VNFHSRFEPDHDVGTSAATGSPHFATDEMFYLAVKQDLVSILFKLGTWCRL
jgi:hypothetical protein